MNLYYNTTAQCRVDESNTRIAAKPVIHYGSCPAWELHFFSGDPSETPEPVDLSDIISWRAAVDSDWNSNTEPMCRTLDEDIDASQAADGIISVPVNANTQRYLAVVDGKQSVPAWFELRGFDDQGNVTLVVLLNITCSNSIDPTGGAEPEPVDNDTATMTWVTSLLGGYAGLSTQNSFSDANTFAAGISVQGKIVQGAAVGSTRWNDTHNNGAVFGNASKAANFALAEGYATNANAVYSHAEGNSTTVAGAGAGGHAEGYAVSVKHPYSHAEGYTTVTGNDCQHVAGKFNVETSNAARVTGGGTAVNARRNIEILDWNGNLTIAGDLTFVPSGAAEATTLTALAGRIGALEDAVGTFETEAMAIIGEESAGQE